MHDSERFNRHHYREHPSDTELQVRVTEELERSRDVDADGCEVSVDHAVVRLEGHVLDLAHDEHIRKAAMRVQGIIAVIDELGPGTPSV